MNSDRCPPAPVHSLSHVHTEHCTHCGGELEYERKYEVRERLMQALFGAVFRAKGIEPTRSRGKNPVTVYVRSMDPELLDQVWARFCALAPELDEQLLAVTARFIEERCGVKVRIDPRE